MAICTSQAKRRVIERGIDNKQLGYWAWIKFQGTMNNTI